MKYYIFHTSNCGSTLLACMLSKSIPTLTEPKWSHELREKNDIFDQLNSIQKNHNDNTLVKYSSLICEIMPNVDGKKVFLYNNFEDHLKKLQSITPPDHFNMRLEAVEWTKRFTWACISNDVLYMQSNYFLNNRHDACKLVCDHFGIDYVPTKEIDFHVKDAGYNHQDFPIEIK